MRRGFHRFEWWYGGCRTSSDSRWFIWKSWHVPGLKRYLSSPCVENFIYPSLHISNTARRLLTNSSGLKSWLGHFSEIKCLILLPLLKTLQKFFKIPRNLVLTLSNAFAFYFSVSLLCFCFSLFFQFHCKDNIKYFCHHSDTPNC